ncbi:MAG: response regulator [Oxalobacteraceae bacterium]|nr:MAG: response regulator [Oxalobacteraceae bacterium]
MYQMLGFDSDFDLTAADTRAQARTRSIVAVVVFTSGLTAIEWRVMVIWAAVFALGDSLLWVATSPANQRLNPLGFRVLRLTATWISTCAWVTAGALWWIYGGDIGKAAGTALIGGVLIYMIRGCHKSLAQMLVTGGPPTVALLVLPWLEATWRDKFGLFTCCSLLVAYALSSAISAVRSYTQLRATTDALIVKQTEAEAASVAKSEFLANMSHEIRTPLNGVMAMAHVLAEAPLPPRESEAARLICSSGRTLERLLSDVLDLAKVEAGQLEIHHSSFNVGELARTVSELCRPTAEANGVALSLVIEDAADSVVTGDEVRVRQVLTNLLSNAIKFTPHGSVTVTIARTQTGSFRFSVQDTGVGFGAPEKARIFERFQQADGTITRRFGGTGLGLSISKHLIELMGGVLDCESEVGVGSNFWFELELPEVETAEPRLQEREVGSASSSTRLLVVDDHPTNLKVVEIILEGAGMSVTTAADGEEAVACWTASGFDLILMDMQMPVMDGLSAVRAIRLSEASSGRSRTPIIMLTANASAAHIQAGAAAGADGHLTKPITPGALFDTIGAALAERGPSTALAVA